MRFGGQRIRGVRGGEKGSTFGGLGDPKASPNDGSLYFIKRSGTFFGTCGKKGSTLLSFSAHGYLALRGLRQRGKELGKRGKA